MATAGLFFLCSGICSIGHLLGIYRMGDPDGVDGHTGAKECYSSDGCRPAFKADGEIGVFDEGRDAVRHFDEFVFHDGNLLCGAWCSGVCDYIIG